ncbi:DNA repair protein RecN [Sphingomonas rhizophila]|uniref:DNA repair protein RecN n=1 Tax=Sphingomonas rhizophila TaxID=2071607 RepID=A0A7G9S9Q3_9SPHN|nr:DNA repair protein RecN [Sphingomonas rhizophila]QNN64578.1 DNA repair protein RecN [Sphingomonas rhizophila]
MLRQLSIRDVVLIEALELEFEAGLGVLTGETGAGKSILLDALGLALGVRADTGLVRSGQAQASVSAAFELDSGHPALAALDEQGIEREPGEPLILRRTLKSDGGSRAFAGGAAVAAAGLRDIAADLVEIHGQHDDRGLLNPRGHRDLLDRFAGIDIAPVRSAWTRLSVLEAELAAERAKLDEANRDREWLDYAIGEIDALGVEVGEEERLASLRQDMKAAARIEDDLGALDDLFGGSDGGLAQLRQAARRLERIAEAHPLLAEALASVDRATIETAEAEDKVAEARRALAHSPAELENAEARLFDIRGLARKHRVEPDRLPGLLDELRQRRGAIDSGEERIAGIEQDLTAARAAYDEVASAISAERRAAGARLDTAVAGELVPLKLDAAQFRTAVTVTDAGPAGIDRAEFEISTNPGAPFGPLSKIASGGELSRFILALKVALAEAGAAATMIFDEIDRGVGGAVASAIGERLARLAQKSQLLVVTHSPQVAARAAHHYRIEKASDGTVTRTSVRRLTEDERREEIARMLSGAAITDEARAQAAKLLEAA